MLFEKLQVLIYVSASFKELSKLKKNKNKTNNKTNYLEVISSLVYFCVSSVVSCAE